MLVARREDRLRQLADAIAVLGQPKPLVLALDLADRNAAQAIKSALQQNGCEAQYVVNNAGFSVFGRFAETDLTRELELLSVNVVALTAMTKLFLPTMIARRSGRTSR